MVSDALSDNLSYDSDDDLRPSALFVSDEQLDCKAVAYLIQSLGLALLHTLTILI